MAVVTALVVQEKIKEFSKNCYFMSLSGDAREACKIPEEKVGLGQGCNEWLLQVCT